MNKDKLNANLAKKAHILIFQDYLSVNNVNLGIIILIIINQAVYLVKKDIIHHNMGQFIVNHVTFIAFLKLFINEKSKKIIKINGDG